MHLRPLPALLDNYIWLLDDGTHAVAVDPGVADPVIDALSAGGLELVGVLLTHHHPDHIAGASGLLRRNPGLPVYAPRDTRVPAFARAVGEGDTVVIEALGLSWDVLEVPGHTTSHIAFLGAGILFSGDTLFSLGCGRMFEGTPEQFVRSLARFSALPGATRVCCGHEYTVANGHFALAVDPSNARLAHRFGVAQRLRQAGEPTLPSTIDDELAANPFLRIGTQAVREALGARHGSAPRDDIEAFTWLRAWKDGFRAPAG